MIDTIPNAKVNKIFGNGNIWSVKNIQLPFLAGRKQKIPTISWIVGIFLLLLRFALLEELLQLGGQFLAAGVVVLGQYLALGVEEIHRGHGLHLVVVGHLGREEVGPL